LLFRITVLSRITFLLFNTGKTLAYVLPINERLIAQLAAGGDARKTGGALGEPSRGRGRAPSVLVVVPTRELCLQVSRVWTSVAAGRLLLVSVYGGSPMTPQQAKLRAGVDLVVGTPGRLVDLTDRGDLTLRTLQHLVLDEADQMLEIGFKDDLEKLFQVDALLCVPVRLSVCGECARLCSCLCVCVCACVRACVSAWMHGCMQLMIQKPYTLMYVWIRRR